jgi:hypothetical protein
MDLSRRAVVTGAAGIFAGLATTGRAAPPAALPDRLAPRAMVADLEIVRRAYALLHPGLARYLGPGAFDALVDRAIGWAGRDRSPADFYLALARLTAAVRCGHTHANPANQRRVVQQDLLGRRDRLPVCTAWIDGSLAVTDGLESGIAPGTRIDAVDGVSMDRLRRAMLPLSRADGSNDAKRLAQLELRPGDRFAAFDVLRPLLFGRGADDMVMLAITDASGRQRVLRLPTLAEGRRGTPASGDPQHGWRFTIDGDGIGRLTMPDWALYDSLWDWRGFLDASVDALVAADARGLVVDLRDNEGGIDCGDVLLARLVARPVEDAVTRRLVRFRETPADLRPVLDTWDPSFHTLGRDAVPVADAPGFLALGEATPRRIEPRGRRFTGPVAVLVGATCSSATFHFAQLVRRCGAATLVGMPTGGNRRGINGGCYFFVRLPETGFEVDLPLVGYFPLTPQPDAGLVPEILVRPRLDDLRRGRDRALAVARAGMGRA